MSQPHVILPLPTDPMLKVEALLRPYPIDAGQLLEHVMQHNPEWSEDPMAYSEREALLEGYLSDLGYFGSTAEDWKGFLWDLHQHVDEVMRDLHRHLAQQGVMDHNRPSLTVTRWIGNDLLVRLDPPPLALSA